MGFDQQEFFWTTPESLGIEELAVMIGTSDMGALANLGNRSFRRWIEVHKQWSMIELS